MKIQEWPLDGLKTNPRQAEFGDIDGVAFDELLASVRAEGLHHPILVTAEGVIVAGHQRVRALRKLGKQTAPVQVVDGDGSRQFYTSNLCCRNLTPLMKARAIAGLLEVEREEASRQSSDGELRERIGEQLGISGREVSRLLQLLRLPTAIQRAVDNGLSRAKALRVERLPAAVQKEIARRIEAGEDAEGVVREALDTHETGSASHTETESVEDRFIMLVDFLNECLGEISVEADRLAATSASIKAGPTLFARASETLGRISLKVKQVREANTACLKQMIDQAANQQEARDRQDTMSQVGT